MASKRHVLRVPDFDLEELRSRLRGTRWPVAWPGHDAGAGWQAGTDEGELRRLETWAPVSRHDWRRRTPRPWSAFICWRSPTRRATTRPPSRPGNGTTSTRWPRGSRTPAVMSTSR